MSTSAEPGTTFAERVRMRRIQLGLSYSDLALRLKSRGVTFSRQAISLWERGKRDRHFSDHELGLLADALGCTAEELWAGYETPPQNIRTMTVFTRFPCYPLMRVLDHSEMKFALPNALYASDVRVGAFLSDTLYRYASRDLCR